MHNTSDNHKHTHSHDHSHGHSHNDSHSHVEEVFNSSPAGFADSVNLKEYEKRNSSREELQGMPENKMEQLYDIAWKQRKEATATIVTMTEEMLSRMVKEHFPESVEIVLYEDHSHDAPHAHVKHVVNSEGLILIDGTSDEWHDLSWTPDVDELVWDLYNLDRQGFQREGHNRYRRIAIF